VYPNLYIIYKDGNNGNKAVLCTHGHLFDAGWNLMTDAIYHFTRTLVSPAPLKPPPISMAGERKYL
jgi:hypothetical protein